METRCIERVSAGVLVERIEKGGSKGKSSRIRRCIGKTIIVVTMGRDLSRHSILDSRSGHQFLVQTESLRVLITENRLLSTERGPV